MKKAGSKTLFIAMVVSLGGFLFGFDASVISGVVKFIKPEFDLNDLQLGWVVSSPTFSAMFAMTFAGKLGDMFSRKKVLISVAFLYALSAGMSAMASSYEMLVVARMIGGLAFGAALILAPIYIAEVSPAKIRGKLVSVQQLNIVVGISVAYFTNYFLLGLVSDTGSITNATVWRWMLGIEFIPAILYFFLLFLVPNSPRWLYLKDRAGAAYKALKRLFGKEEADREVALIEASLVEQEDLKKSVSLKDLFSKSMQFVLVVGLVLGVLQQITGVNAIFFYATSIFEQSGVGSNASFAQAVLVGIINVVFTLLAMALIDRMGRRPLLLIGLAGITLSMFLTAWGFNQSTYKLSAQDAASIQGLEISEMQAVMGVDYENDIDFKTALKGALGEKDYAIYESQILEKAINTNALLILLGILGFVASFAFSLGPVMWVMLSELFPNRLRGLAISFVGLVNSSVSWLIQFIFPWEISVFGNALTYFIFGMLGLVGLVILYKILPETKGKSLEQLEKELVRR